MCRFFRCGTVVRIDLRAYSAAAERNYKVSTLFWARLSQGNFGHSPQILSFDLDNLCAGAFGHRPLGIRRDRFFFGYQ